VTAAIEHQALPNSSGSLAIIERKRASTECRALQLSGLLRARHGITLQVADVSRSCAAASAKRALSRFASDPSRAPRKTFSSVLTFGASAG